MHLRVWTQPLTDDDHVAGGGRRRVPRVRRTLRPQDIQGEPITITGYRRGDDEQYRHAFQVWDIICAEGSGGRLKTSGVVLMKEVERFFARYPGQKLGPVRIIRKQGKEHEYWAFAGVADTAVDTNAPSTDTLDAQADALWQATHPYAGLYFIFDTEAIPDELLNRRVLMWEVCGLTLAEVQQYAREGTIDPLLLDRLVARGLAYDPLALSRAEVATCREYARRHGMALHTLNDFITDVFFPYVSDLGALCIGFNLPFDLSRLARAVVEARGNMRGGFSFQYSPAHPRVRIRHISEAVHFMDLTIPFNPAAAQGAEKREGFLDLHTLAHALLDRNHSLDSLSRLFGLPPKEDVDFGGPITPEFLDYLSGDIERTKGCWQNLREIARGHHLRSMEIHKTYSGASIGKQYYRDMGIKPFFAKNPQFSNKMLGYVMMTYFGGRTEMRYRREIAEVIYLDFMAMYPTINTLLGLWRYVIAHHIEVQEATEAVKQLVDHVTAGDLLEDQAIWKELAAFQKAGGVTAESVYQAKDDPNNVLVLHSFDSMAAAEAFVASPELREAMQKAGVEGMPRIEFFEEAP
jgi:quinol monooxygenase YgiN